VRLVMAILMLAGATPARAEPITMAIVPSVVNAATYIAEEKGYFRDAGLDVTIERIDSLSKVVAFLASGKVQLAQGGINAGYFNAVAQGMPLTLAMESGSTPTYHQIALRLDLKDKIKTVADLKGRVVGLSAPGSLSVYEFGRTLESAGLTLKDVEIKYLSFAQMGAALANGALDAALMVAPFTDVAIARKMAVAWIDPEDGFVKTVPIASIGIMANVDWLKQNQAAAEKLFVALARATRDYCQAYHHGPNRAEVIEIFVKHKIAADRALLDSMPWQARDPNGAINVASLDDIQNFFKQEGVIARTAPRERLADTSFAAVVAKALGPFELANQGSTKKGCR
jgi:NitT/TauT family transport system substrate-binding protein